jgi:predicted nucleotidyltransferase
MRRVELLEFLANHREVLNRDFRVKSLELFGSVARDEATIHSDVDLLVEFDRPTGLFGLFRLQDYLEDQLGCRVDLGTRGSLKPQLRQRVLAEAIHGC